MSRQRTFLIFLLGHIKLVDFGLSKLVKLGERTGTICGTLQYMGKVEIQKILNKTLKWYITNENFKKNTSEEKMFFPICTINKLLYFPFLFFRFLKTEKNKDVLRILHVRRFKIIDWVIYTFAPVSKLLIINFCWT